MRTVSFLALFAIAFEAASIFFYRFSESFSTYGFPSRLTASVLAGFPFVVIIALIFTLVFLLFQRKGRSALKCLGLLACVLLGKIVGMIFAPILYFG